MHPNAHRSELNWRHNYINQWMKHLHYLYYQFFLTACRFTTNALTPKRNVSLNWPNHWHTQCVVRRYRYSSRSSYTLMVNLTCQIHQNHLYTHDTLTYAICNKNSQWSEISCHGPITCIIIKYYVNWSWFPAYS